MIVDTGVLVATADAGDPHHERCDRVLRTAPGRLVIPAMVVAEACYLIARNLGSRPEALFMESLATNRYRIEVPIPADCRRIAELVRKYEDFPLGGTDASIVALAERTGETEIATLDRRHFGVVRPHHVPAFTLVP